MDIKTTTNTTVKTTIKIGFTDILEFLVSKKVINLSVQSVDKMYVEVPGGGDWSNTKLDIEDDCITVELKTM